MGAVGLNLEDLDSATGQLIPINEQAARIRAIREMAADKGLSSFFLNCRTDVYLGSPVSPEKRYDETLKRLRAWEEAGADGLYAPGLTDIELISQLCKEINRPYNVLGGPWISSYVALREAGVQRVSIGSGIARAVGTYTKNAYHDFVKGDYQFAKEAIPYADVNNLFK